MRSKTERILAFLCAVVLVATTVLGNWYTKQAEAADNVVPVTLDGFDNLTISNFVGDGWRNQGQTLTAMTVNGTEYWGYAASGLTNFDKKLVSLKVTFEGGGYQNSIMFGGNATWVGFNLYPSTDGSELVVAKTWGSTITSSATPTLSAHTAGVSSFINNELLIQMSFEHGEVVDGKTDLKLGIYINGKLYNNEVFTIAECNVSTLGARLAFYPQTTGQNIIVGEEVQFPARPIEPVTLDGFDNLTISDFVNGSGSQLAAGDYQAGAIYDYSASGLTNLDKKLISLNVTFKGGTYKHSLLVGGNATWVGFNLCPSDDGSQLTVSKTWGSAITSSATPTLSAVTAGLNSFIGEEFLLQMSFEYGEVVGGKADLKLGIYINGILYNNEVFTIEDCSMSASGAYLSVYCAAGSEGIRIGEEVEFSVVPDEPTEPTPVELDGYKNLTIKNFKDAETTAALTPGTGSLTGYKRYLTSHCTNFDKVLLSMKVTFAAGTYATRLDMAGGASSGGWYSGLWIHPSNATGDELWIVSEAQDGNGFYGTTDERQSFAITPAEAGVNKFVGEEFILQLAFDFGEEVSGKADLTIGVYINGNLAKTHTFAGCNVSKFGNYLNFNNGASITYDNVILSDTPDGPDPSGTPDIPDTPVGPVEPVELDGFRNLTISDFVGNSTHTQGTTLTEGRYEAPNYYGYDVKGVENFDRKLLSLNVTFEAGGWQNSIMFAGNGQWVGFNLYPSADGSQLFVSKTWGSTITSSATPILSAQTAGVDSFVGEEFLLQMSFEYGQEIAGKADLKLGIYINGILYNNQVFTIADCNTNTFGDRLAFYPQTEGQAIIIGEEVDMPKDDEYEEETLYQKITFDSFGIADGKYKYVSGKTAVSGTAIGRETLNKTVICGDILYEGSDNSQIIWGGTSAMNGLRMNPKLDGTMELTWYEGNTKTPIATLDAETAGVVFIGEKYGIRLSSELVDADKDGKKDDLKIGISFNGLLYNKEYFYLNDMAGKYGNYFSVYCAEKSDTVTLNSAPELVSRKPNADFEKVTFEYFGLADGTYKCDGTDQSTFSGKGVETLDKKVLCGDILIDGEGKNSLMVGGKQIWYGLRFITQDDGSILLIWVDEDGTPWIETFNSAVAGTTLIGEWMNLMISTEIVDADGDGANDDIEFGFWFNGVLYNDKYYTVIDKASRLGKCFGFDCADEGTSISVRSIPEYVKGFDYSIYGLTEDWKKTLLDTDFKVYKEVGGSRDPEPFTGDWTEIGKALTLFGTVTIVVIAASIYVVLQRRKNDRG